MFILRSLRYKASKMRGKEAIRRLMQKIPLRRISTTEKRREAENPDCAPAAGYAGSMLPFGINHPGYLLTGFIIYAGTGLGLPFAILRHQLIKSAG